MHINVEVQQSNILQYGSLSTNEKEPFLALTLVLKYNNIWHMVQYGSPLTNKKEAIIDC